MISKLIMLYHSFVKNKNMNRIGITPEINRENQTRKGHQVFPRF